MRKKLHAAGDSNSMLFLPALLLLLSFLLHRVTAKLHCFQTIRWLITRISMPSAVPTDRTRSLSWPTTSRDSCPGGPNYYSFGENIRYEIPIDNDARTPGDDSNDYTFQLI